MSGIAKNKMTFIVMIVLFSLLLAPAAAVQATETPKPAGEVAPGNPTPSAGKAPAAQTGNKSKPAPGADSTDEYFNIIFFVLILSVVFESAMTPIFNWSKFLVHFDHKGFKVPITTAIALFVFYRYKIDIISDLEIAYRGKTAGPFPGGYILTSLLIAGGSSGVLEVLKILKLRNPTEREERKKQLIQEAAAEEARKKAEAEAATTAAEANKDGKAGEAAAPETGAEPPKG